MFFLSPVQTPVWLSPFVLVRATDGSCSGEQGPSSAPRHLFPGDNTGSPSVHKWSESAPFCLGMISYISKVSTFTAELFGSSTDDSGSWFWQPGDYRNVQFHNWSKLIHCWSPAKRQFSQPRAHAPSALTLVFLWLGRLWHRGLTGLRAILPSSSPFGRVNLCVVQLAGWAVHLIRAFKVSCRPSQKLWGVRAGSCLGMGCMHSSIPLNIKKMGLTAMCYIMVPYIWYTCNWGVFLWYVGLRC